MPMNAKMFTRRILRCLAASLLTLALSWCFAGCKAPTGGVAGHFEAMVAIGERHKDDCNSMGTELQGYLASHQLKLDAAIRQLDSTGDAQVKRISEATRRIDNVVKPCRFDPNVDEFARKIAPLIREATSRGNP